MYMIRKHILLITFLHESKLIFWHALKWFKVLLSNSYNTSHLFANI